MEGKYAWEIGMGKIAQYFVTTLQHCQVERLLGTFVTRTERKHAMKTSMVLNAIFVALQLGLDHQKAIQYVNNQIWDCTTVKWREEVTWKISNVRKNGRTQIA
jgi:acetolactate synthase regulatory subunit